MSGVCTVGKLNRHSFVYLSYFSNSFAGYFLAVQSQIFSEYLRTIHSITIRTENVIKYDQ